MARTEMSRGFVAEVAERPPKVQAAWPATAAWMAGALVIALVSLFWWDTLRQWPTMITASPGESSVTALDLPPQP